MKNMLRFSVLGLMSVITLACGDEAAPTRPLTNNQTTTNNQTQTDQTTNGTNNQTATNNETNNQTATNNQTTTNNQTNTNNQTTTNNQTMSAETLYVSTTDAYAAGPLATQRFELEDGDNGAPREILVVAPSAPGIYAVVAFHHGFTLRTGYYSDYLEHLASHGFIVVAPQMGTNAFGAPTVSEEADDAQEVYDWMRGNLGAVTGVTPSFDHFGVSGHSRGAKVAWTILRREQSLYQAIIGLDPVDGTGGPLGGQPRVANTAFPVSLPTLIIGTGLGPTGFQACAPEGDNYEQFFDASVSATLLLANAYGHNDMLDANNSCGITCTLCADGPSDGGLRTLTYGSSTMLLRAALQGRTQDQAAITMNLPIQNVTIDTK